MPVTMITTTTIITIVATHNKVAGGVRQSRRARWCSRDVRARRRQCPGLTCRFEAIARVKGDGSSVPIADSQQDASEPVLLRPRDDGGDQGVANALAARFGRYPHGIEGCGIIGSSADDEADVLMIPLRDEDGRIAPRQAILPLLVRQLQFEPNASGASANA